MSNTRPTASRVTQNQLWTALSWSFAVFTLLYAFAFIVLTVGEFDEECNRGVVSGGGRLIETGVRSFPPETWCRFEGGTVSSAPTWIGPVLYALLALTVVLGIWALAAKFTKVHGDARKGDA